MYVHTLDLFKKSNVKCLNGKKMLFLRKMITASTSRGTAKFYKVIVCNDRDLRRKYCKLYLSSYYTVRITKIIT